MNILIVSHYFEDHGGGIEIVAGHLARELAALGHRVSWAATGTGVPAQAIPGVERVLLAAWNAVERATGLPLPVLFPRSVARLIKSVRAADVVIVHDGIYTTSLVALAAARRRRVPSLVIQHIGEIPYRNPLLRGLMTIANRLAVRPALSRADQVVFISETVRRFFAATTFRRPPLLVFNGVDHATFQAPTSAERSAAKAELGLDEGRKAAIFVGRFVGKKGLPHIKEAARLSPATDFLLVGGGPIDPSTWNLPNVRILGSLPPRHVARAYQAADVLVLPSIGEGFPLVVQEALACGLEVICSDECAAADPQAAGLLTGIAIDHDPAITGRRLADCLGSEAPQSVSSAVTRATVAKDRYSWINVARHYDRAIRRLAGERLSVGGDEPAANDAAIAMKSIRA